jgi:hypothetical protein
MMSFHMHTSYIKISVKDAMFLKRACMLCFLLKAYIQININFIVFSKKKP